MKPFDELTQEELVTLAEETIRYYIDLECAECGVPLLPPEPPIAPPKEPVEPDATVYQVGGVTSLTFLSREDAERVASVLNQCERVDLWYLSGPSFKKKIIPARDPMQVTQERAFSEHLAARMKDAIEAHERAVKRYTDEKAAYDKALRGRQNVEGAIRGRIEEAVELKYRVESRTAEFTRYLQLAEGNRRVAARFLIKAYPDSAGLLPDLFSEFSDLLPAEKTVAAPEMDEIPL